MDYNIITDNKQSDQEESNSDNDTISDIVPDILPDTTVAATETETTTETAATNAISDIFYEESEFMPYDFLPLKRKRECHNNEEKSDIEQIQNNSQEIFDPIFGVITDINKNNLYLPEFIENNNIIRKIVSNIPIEYKKRLDILNKYRIYSENNKRSPEYVLINGLKIQEYVERIFKAHFINIKLKYIFKRFVQIYKIYKIDKSYIPELDIVTLEPPHNPISVYDLKLKRKFVFSAKSLANTIHSSLIFHQDTFPEPKEPKNINTNKPFNYEQLVSIYYQLKKYGQINWSIATFRQLNFYLPKWKLYHNPLLTFMSIKKEICEGESITSKEIIYDFIVSKMEELQENITEMRLNAYEIAIFRMIPMHPYIHRFKPLIISFYETQQFKVDASHIINVLYKEIIKDEDKFIVDIIVGQL